MTKTHGDARICGRDARAPGQTKPAPTICYNMGGLPLRYRSGKRKAGSRITNHPPKRFCRHGRHRPHSIRSAARFGARRLRRLMSIRSAGCGLRRARRRGLRATPAAGCFTPSKPAPSSPSCGRLGSASMGSPAALYMKRGWRGWRRAMDRPLTPIPPPSRIRRWRTRSPPPTFFRSTRSRSWRRRWRSRPRLRSRRLWASASTRKSVSRTMSGMILAAPIPSSAFRCRVSRRWRGAPARRGAWRALTYIPTANPTTWASWRERRRR